MRHLYWFKITALIASTILHAENNVVKKVLPNGLTVLIIEKPNTEDVAIQLYYKVGSRDEETNEKGIAHLLEHMVFKGTDILSETDILALTNKLSGYANAFTSYDCTSFIFNFPKRYWHHALPVLASCMHNCTFKDDLLNAEFKAVIQELKMNRDNYPRQLVEELVTSVFPEKMGCPGQSFFQERHKNKKSNMLQNTKGTKCINQR